MTKMRERVIYILKHNVFIQKLYTKVVSLFFCVVSVFVKTDENLILIVSMMGKNFGDSPKVLYDYIRSKKDYQQYRFIWAFENPNDFPEIESVKIDTPKYFYTAFRAKYWLTNTNIERGLRFKKKNQIYLNTWHGTPIKKIGNDCPGRKDFSFDTVNYLVVSSEYEERVFKTAFCANPNSYLRCGMPRNEELWEAQKIDKGEIRKKLNVPLDKKIILYAPTWRESDDHGKSYAIKPPIHFDKWEKILGNNYIVMFRAHHITNKVLGVKYNDFVRNVSDYPEVNHLMIAADILITDYSAIAFDFSILCKPILIYAYDYESYLKNRGVYFDMNQEYPNAVCRTESELLSRVTDLDYSNECKKTEKFRDKFIQYKGNAIECCVKNFLNN